MSSNLPVESTKSCIPFTKTSWK